MSVKQGHIKNLFFLFYGMIWTWIEPQSPWSLEKKKKYIYLVIHRQICFVLSELISVARQYLPAAGIESRLTETPSQSF